MTTEQIISAIDAKAEQLRQKENNLEAILDAAMEERDERKTTEAKNMLRFNQKQQSELREARRLIVQNPVEMLVEDGML